ncbi:GTP-binding protein [Coprobacillaceae bacterium CR2/5/TPMF4]|nr:GTP-binding protein [Coprobacillaceae bacterium CR2/5/TPMF4]
MIDTPGHVDFSTEMERTLQVLDYAILVINGLDGVQAHSETIWHLLKHYQIPTFVFVNKMDISLKDKHELIEDLKRILANNVMILII